MAVDYAGLLVMQIKALGLEAPEREARVVRDRRWRFDLAWPTRRLAMEIEGGVWTRGRHTRPSGFLKDMEKYNRAALDGWRVLRVTPQQVRAGEAVHLVERALKQT